jgi:hypothetical protein
MWRYAFTIPFGGKKDAGLWRNIEKQSKKLREKRNKLYLFSYPVVMSDFTGFSESTERASSLLLMEGMSAASSTGDVGGFITRSAGCSFCHSEYLVFYGDI